jgi:hypothetical protein
MTMRRRRRRRRMLLDDMTKDNAPQPLFSPLSLSLSLLENYNILFTA